MILLLFTGDSEQGRGMSSAPRTSVSRCVLFLGGATIIDFVSLQVRTSNTGFLRLSDEKNT